MTCGTPTYFRLVQRLLNTAGIRPLAEGENGKVVVVSRGTDALGIVNLGEQPRTLKLPYSGKDRLNGKPVEREINLQPLQVVITEQTR